MSPREDEPFPTEVSGASSAHPASVSELKELVGTSVLHNMNNIMGESILNVPNNTDRQSPTYIDPSGDPELRKIIEEPQFIWLQQFVSRYYPDGLPSHIDVNLLYWELRSSPGPGCRNHGTWKRVCRILSRTIDWVSGGGGNWKFQSAKKKMPELGPPSIVMAAVLLGSVVPGRQIRGKSVSPRRQIFDLLDSAGLAFILQEPSNRMVPKFWEGADFDSFAWRHANMRFWYGPIQRHKPVVDLNAYFRVGRHSLIKYRGVVEEPLQAIMRKLDADYAWFQKAQKALLATLEVMPKCDATMDWVRKKFFASSETAHASRFEVVSVAGPSMTEGSTSNDEDILEISEQEFAQRNPTEVGEPFKSRHRRDLDEYSPATTRDRDQSRSPPRQDVRLDHRGRPNERMNPMDIRNLLG